MKELVDGIWWDSEAREACQRLFFAIDNGELDDEIAEMSLMSGLAVHGAGAYGKTWGGMWGDLTSLLSSQGYGKTLGRLLSAGIAPYEGDSYKKPALSIACGSQRAGTLECAKLLLEAGAHPDGKGEGASSLPLHEAILGRDGEAKVGALLAAGANPKFGDNHGWDFLRAALHSRYEEIGQLAVGLEAEQTGRGAPDGDLRLEKALCLAIDHGSAKVVDALLRKGADPLKDVDAAVGGRRVVKNACERLGLHTHLGPSEQAGLGEALVEFLARVDVEKATKYAQVYKDRYGPDAVPGCLALLESRDLAREVGAESRNPPARSPARSL